jgi:hypothetical protein
MMRLQKWVKYVDTAIHIVLLAKSKCSVEDSNILNI